MNLTFLSRRGGWAGVSALALVLILPAALAACPNCKLSMDGADGPGGPTGLAGESGNMAAGYAYSIYLMLGVLLVLAVSLVLFIRRQVLNMPARPVESEALPR